MKIGISSTSNTENAIFDKRFGRGAWFCIYNTEQNEVEFVENEFVDASNGAGTKVTEKMIELGVSKVISGHFGPKAETLLKKFNVEMDVVHEDNITVKEIINRIN